MKILLKYPTRNRPVLFLKNIKEYVSQCHNLSDIEFIVSYDTDDKSITQDVLLEAKKIYPHIKLIEGTSNNKIHACNRDIEKATSNWDILLLISDDMFVQSYGWDEEIRKAMDSFYPDTNGCLWFHDGSKQKVISTLSCIGRKYYESFGYIYYPEYKSFFCDNEYTEIATQKNKITFIDNVIIKHEHPHWGGGVKMDDLYIKNDIHWKHDENLFNKRKLTNFAV
jgi:hypothetical protein